MLNIPRSFDSQLMALQLLLRCEDVAETLLCVHWNYYTRYCKPLRKMRAEALEANDRSLRETMVESSCAYKVSLLG